MMIKRCFAKIFTSHPSLAAYYSSATSHILALI